jgi:hypothetical protein
MSLSATEERRRIVIDTIDRYIFRVATPDDVPAIVALWPEHWEEVHYKDRGIVPDEPRYIAWLTRMITYGGETFLLAEADGEVVGFFSYGLDHNFSEKPVAVMDKFFVARKHRRSAIASILCGLGIDAAAQDGACAFHAPITSETAAARGLENMLAKHGFTQIGTVMGRAI